MVRVARLELARTKALGFEASVSTIPPHPHFVSFVSMAGLECAGPRAKDEKIGAQGGTRTRTASRPSPPQDDVSTIPPPGQVPALLLLHG